MRISDWSSDVCSSDLINMLYGANHMLARVLTAIVAALPDGQKRIAADVMTDLWSDYRATKDVADRQAHDLLARAHLNGATQTWNELQRLLAEHAPPQSRE